MNLMNYMRIGGEHMVGIYAIVNIINDKVYVGQAVDISHTTSMEACYC